MELRLNSTMLPVPIKQNTQKLKSNGRTKNVQSLEADQKKVGAKSMPEKTLTPRSKEKTCHQSRNPEGLRNIFLKYWNLILSKEALNKGICSKVFQHKQGQGAHVFRSCSMGKNGHFQDSY